MKNLMLIETLLNAQKEILKQELKEKPELNNYLIQAESTLERFQNELNVLKDVYTKNNLTNTQKYPQEIKYSDETLKLIQKIHGGEYIMTSKELPSEKNSYTKIDNKHTIQASVELKVNHKGKLQKEIPNQRTLFTVQNNNTEYGKNITVLNDEISLNIYHNEFEPNNSEEYNMSFRCIKSKLGIENKAHVRFTGAGVNKIKAFVEQMETLRKLILNQKQDTISFQPDTSESIEQYVKEVIEENAEAFKDPKYNDDSTYYNEYWAVTDNVSSDIPLTLHIGIDYNID